MGVERTSVAAAGLKPDAGGGDLVGREETEQIEPAVEGAKRLGYDGAGPMFLEAVCHRGTHRKAMRKSQFDTVVTMVRGQEHILVKLLGVCSMGGT